ncbi:uncharacterized protein LOC120282661 isoform X2 [Dioscorea cayenensis subsp. rotundata]|uniref:Uncharacterized protein LOC120282661 isoform X2 n=1 Tax=Dioscorea cayennensis subsp. rotundata TaxID=55577 RepID=A0AB40CZ98_DIOCR|nr:uncharacterized protein LOC120282661 isoform X2 [Dioscorea cayenensis subsp. rotundata]
MRGVGGPLLCIGDLLSDVAADDSGDSGSQEGSPPSSPTVASGNPVHPSHLHQLFEENYDQLVKSLSGHDHSWTGLTLKLCSALKTADKLVSSANANSSLLLEKVEMLESIIKRGDSAVEAAKAIPNMQTGKTELSKETEWKIE